MGAKLKRGIQSYLASQVFESYLSILLISEGHVLAEELLIGNVQLIYFIVYLIYAKYQWSAV